MKVGVTAGVGDRPPAELAFDAIDGERRHADGHGREQAAGDERRRAAIEEDACRAEGHGVGESHGEDGDARERFPGIGDEPAHGADNEQRTEVVSDVGGLEGRGGLRFGKQFAAKRLKDARVKAGAFDRGLQLRLREGFHAGSIAFGRQLCAGYSRGTMLGWRSSSRCVCRIQSWHRRRMRR